MNKAKKFSGLKLAKSCITILVGGNASGELKLKPLFIHTSKTPNCFKDNKIKKEDSPVFWDSNKTAWMTAELFEKWFKENFIPQAKLFC